MKDADRGAFPLRTEDNDYSGLDISGVRLEGSKALSHAFLNGTNINDAGFRGVEMDQCEFGEAHISNSEFTESDLSGSDFVRAVVEKTEFRRCSFYNGEWRESEFVDVLFEDCDFTHNTVNLCRFRNCRFTGTTTESMNHRSINYNTFSQCSFSQYIHSEYVLSQSFGLPAPTTSLPVKRSAVPTLQGVCRLSEVKDFRVRDLAAAIELECENQKERPNKILLEFIANIVVALATERRISPSSMIYIEGLLSAVAKVLTSNSAFRAAMGAIVDIRNATYDLTTEAIDEEALPDGPCTGFSLFYDEDTLSKEMVGEFGAVLSQVLTERPDALVLAEFRNGSTFAEFIAQASLSIMSVTTALTLLLAQANVIVRKAAQLKASARQFASKPKVKTAAVPKPPKGTALVKSAAPRRRPAKVPAVMKTGAVLPELIPIRIAVEQSGRMLIHLDNRVEITIFR